MPPRLRIKAPAVLFRIIPGTQAVMDGRAVRIVSVLSATKIQVKVEGTGDLIWAKAEELTAFVSSERIRSVIHPLDADPEAEDHARAWCDALSELSFRPSNLQYVAVAKRMKVSSRTVARRHKLFLADPTPMSQLRMPPGPVPGSKRLRSKVEAIVDRAVNDIYLKRTRCPITAVHAYVRQLCAESGLNSPSYKAVRQRVRAIDPMLAVKKRFGTDHALAIQAPSIRGVATNRPLELVQIDHAVVDLIVVSPDTRLPIGRPWITLAIDVHTRCVVGYYLSMDTPTQTSVALCIAHACLPKADWIRDLGLDLEYPMFGKFENVSWDNAKTFRNSGIAAQCERYGIRVKLRPVKKPHFGAYIERYIGTLMGKVHLLPGTTFSNVKQRNDYDSERSSIMSFKELASWIAQEIIGIYHHTEHRGLSGLTPFAKWRSSWTKADDTFHLPSMIASPRHFFIGLLPRQLRAVTREGVSLHGLKYWDPAISQLINDGRRHFIHYNHGDLTRVFLQYQGDYIDLPLTDRSRLPFTIYELREARRSLATNGMRRADEEVVFAAMAQQRKIQDKAAATSKRARMKQARRAAAPENPSTAVDYSMPIVPTNFDEADSV